MTWPTLAASSSFLLFGLSLALSIYLAWRTMKSHRVSDKVVEKRGDLRGGVSSVTPSGSNVRRIGMVGFQEISFSNLRCFDELRFPSLQPSDEESGQWIVLLGNNGVGKSAILRGLALAMTEPSLASALLKVRREPAPFVRIKEESAEIRVRLVEGDAYHVKITTGPVAEDLISHGEPSFYPAVFAYGAQRGSALAGNARSVSFSPLGSVGTLFDESADLIHGETWLRQVRLAALESRGGAGEAFYESVQKLLIDLLPGVEDIDCDSDGVWVSGGQIGRRVPLAALSDGYLTTTGWILDLIARWANRVEQIEGRKPDGTIAQQIDGLVLIDEIDLHLHPLWQTDIISCLRKNFPRLSFVASTHNPLTLLGARPGEVHVLRRDPDTSAVMIEQRDVPPGTRADQVLTGYWFGLSSTLDQETLDLLEQHRSLLRAGVGRDNPQRLRLERELRLRLGTFADTSMDRMALEVASEVMDREQDQSATLTLEERERVRAKILSRLEEKRREQRRG